MHIKWILYFNKLSLKLGENVGKWLVSDSSMSPTFSLWSQMAVSW